MLTATDTSQDFPVHLSPELVLVDPDLARVARSALPARGPFPPVYRDEPSAATARRRPIFAGVVVVAVVLALAAGTGSPVRSSNHTRAAGADLPRPPASATAARSTRAEPRRFVWPRVARAVGYEFQLFRGRMLLLRRRVTAPQFALPSTWRRGKHIERLSPGVYRWYVWPISAETGAPAMRAMIQARLVVDP